MKTFRSHGLTFDVTDSGPSDGEAVVLLHGFPETRDCWSEVIPALTKAGYRVLAPNQRGYSPGARPRSRSAYRMHLLVDDVLALLDAAGIQKAHIAGHDWGGAVAWAIAEWQADRVATVTSLSTPHPRALIRSLVTSNQALMSWYMAMFQLPAIPESFVAGERSGRFWGSIKKSGLPEASIARYRSLLSEPGAARGALNWYRALPLTPPWRLSHCRRPALYLYGDRDTALGPHAAALTQQYVSGPYTMRTLHGVSHWIPETAPQIVVEHLLPHLAAYPISG